MEQVQATRKLLKPTRSVTRQRRRAEKQKQKRTPPACADGFLKQEFVPVTRFNMPCAAHIERIEQDFFNSLLNLSLLYDFTLPDVSGMVFPLNIHRAFQYAEKMVLLKDEELDLIVVQDENHIATLATVKTIPNGMKLYYVQAEPVYRLLQTKENKQLAYLLLSAFTCLHTVVGMPFCDDNFIGGTYDMLEEWLTSDPDEWDRQEFLNRMKDLKAMKRGMKKVRGEIGKTSHLNCYAKRLKVFAPRNRKERELKVTLKRLFDFWQSYPALTFSDFIKENLLSPEKDERMQVDEYFSFYWQSEGWLHDDLMENVNYSLQEKEVSDDPCVVQLFNTPQAKPQHDLTYVTELFDIIWELAGSLNNF